MLHNHTEASINNKEVCILHTESAPNNVATLSSHSMPRVWKFSASALKEFVYSMYSYYKTPKNGNYFSAS